MFIIKAEIIAVGSAEQYQPFFEASADYLRTEFYSMGVQCEGFTAAGTDPAKLFAAVRQAAQHAAVVVVLESPEGAAVSAVTMVLCQGLGLKAELNAEALAAARAHAVKTGRSLTEEEAKAFAAFPQGAVLLPNHSGLVQGYALPAKKQLMLVLPSTPSELSITFSSNVKDLFRPYQATVPTTPEQNRAPGSQTASRVIRAAQLDGEPIPALLRPFVERQNPRVELRGSMGDYEITVEASCQTKAAAVSLCDETVEELQGILGPFLYSLSGERLEELAVQGLSRLGKTLAVAESGSGGLLSQRIKAVPQGPACLGFEAVTPDRQSKSEQLGISKQLLGAHGGSSRQAAAAMALGARKQGETQLGLSITGIFSDQVKSRFQPGTIHVALTDGQQVWVRTLHLNPQGDRDFYRSAAVLQALNMVRLYCASFPHPLPGGMTPAKATGAGKQEGPLERFSAFFASLGGGKKPRTAAGSKELAPSGEQGPRLNLFQKLKAGKLDRNDKIRLGVVGLCAVVFISCLVYIGSVYLESHNNAKLNDALSSLFDQEVDPDEVEGYPLGYQSKFASLYAQNPDVAGWIKIENTQVNYVVVQTTDNAYYERRDFSRKDNQHGVPFVDFRVAQREPSTNTVIYAHNMNDGQMFGELLNYKSLAYYKEHPLVSYDSVYYDGQYKIFGIVVCKKDDPDFSYHNFIEPTTDKEMTDFISKIRERSLINTKVDVGVGDKLLTLSTCDYTFKSSTGDRIARFVVFARKVRDGESTDVDTAGATLNLNPVMPQEWYDTLAKAQEAERKAQEEAEAASVSGKWLTDDEKASLSAEEQKALAASRQSDANSYLTYDEREDVNLSLSYKLDLIAERKADFKLFLYSDESGYSLTKKIDLADERREEALHYLSSSELYSLKNYKQVVEAIEEKKNAVSSDAKWLTKDEISSLSSSEKKALIAKRKKEAEAAGLSSAEIASASSWEDIQDMIAQKGEKTSFIADNKPYLNSSDSSRSLSDLKALVEERKNKAYDAGLSDAEISSCKNWDALKKLIDKKNSENAAAAEAERKAKEAFLKDAAKMKFVSIDTSSATSAQLQKNYEENKAYAESKLTSGEIASCSNWNAILKLIEQKEASSSSGSSGSSSGGSSSGGSSSGGSSSGGSSSGSSESSSSSSSSQSSSPSETSASSESSSSSEPSSSQSSETTEPSPPPESSESSKTDDSANDAADAPPEPSASA